MRFLLHNFIVDEHIKKALEEDIGYGDITTDFLVSNKDILTAFLNAREDGILCGIDIFKKVFKILSPKVEIEVYYADGDRIKKGDRIAKVTGLARFILSGERVALNYIQRMSGIATETFKFQKAIGKNKAQIVDTRKTTPLFRSFEKYSVKIGGGSIHRFNLSDCAMIKDNHIKFAGSITAAVKKLRLNMSHAHKIEVECDTLEQVKEALSVGADIILLDNMSLEMIRECVEVINKKAIIEVSGNVTIDNVEQIAQTGVDIISSSSIVAKAPTLDLALDM